MANDVNVYGVALSSAPTNGTLTCTAVPGNPVAGICANGTFTYTPTAGATAMSGQHLTLSDIALTVRLRALVPVVHDGDVEPVVAGRRPYR